MLSTMGVCQLIFENAPSANGSIVGTTPISTTTGASNGASSSMTENGVRYREIATIVDHRVGERGWE